MLPMSLAEGRQRPWSCRREGAGVLLHVCSKLSGTFASHQNQIRGFGHAIWSSKKILRVHIWARL